MYLGMALRDNSSGLLFWQITNMAWNIKTATDFSICLQISIDITKDINLFHEPWKVITSWQESCPVLNLGPWKRAVAQKLSVDWAWSASTGGTFATLYQAYNTSCTVLTIAGHLLLATSHQTVLYHTIRISDKCTNTMYQNWWSWTGRGV